MHFISKLAEVSTGSKTWFLEACGAITQRKRRLPLNHYDTLVARSAGLIADLLCSAFTKPGALAPRLSSDRPSGPDRLAVSLGGSTIFFGNQSKDVFRRQLEQVFGLRERGWCDVVCS